MAEKYDPQLYADLLAEALPGVIKNEKENERTLEIVAGLMKKGKKRSPEESRLLDLLAALVEDFEDSNYPVAMDSVPFTD